MSINIQVFIHVSKTENKISISNCPLVSMGDGFQDPWGYQNLRMLKSFIWKGLVIESKTYMHSQHSQAQSQKMEMGMTPPLLALVTHCYTFVSCPCYFKLSWPRNNPFKSRNTSTRGQNNDFIEVETPTWAVWYSRNGA